MHKSRHLVFCHDKFLATKVGQGDVSWGNINYSLLTMRNSLMSFLLRDASSLWLNDVVWQRIFFDFIIKIFINRDRWDNAEKVSKAHVGKEKHFSSSRIVGRSEWQPPTLSPTISIVDIDVTYQLCREPWPLWMLVCDSDLKWRCGLTRVWTVKRPNARPASLK